MNRLKILLFSVSIGLLLSMRVAGGLVYNFDTKIDATVTATYDFNSFSSSKDAWGIYSNDGSAPSVLIDTSAVNSADNLGIVDSTKVANDVFFGVSDTLNGDIDKEISVIFTFDLTQLTFSESLNIAIDMGAVGDFEKDDNFDWTYQVDDHSESELFDVVVDESDVHDYQLEAKTITYNDPLKIDNKVISNQIQTFNKEIQVDSSAVSLKLIFTTYADGGSEAFMFDNIVVSSHMPEPASISLLILGGLTVLCYRK
ncbi:hypothetical protein KS4_32140 [Poriferisphaera corsica]|uniref:PEP-CTERM protein-sorting domain-containing protein n=1 Tax=Poriferisphaera corsica TaxID=2528020 RepID=A0A517YY34_9BACT|nr:hypothetical protein [Poriferisphaera corsica]QDU35134.1 hypothetical protein KS4_32140 [Poriferisphaera corsica]